MAKVTGMGHRLLIGGVDISGDITHPLGAKDNAMAVAFQLMLLGSMAFPFVLE